MLLLVLLLSTASGLPPPPQQPASIHPCLGPIGGSPSLWRNNQTQEIHVEIPMDKEHAQISEKDEDILKYLNTPSHESTRGLSTFEKCAVISSVKDNVPLKMQRKASSSQAPHSVRRELFASVLETQRKEMLQVLKNRLKDFKNLRETAMKNKNRKAVRRRDVNIKKYEEAIKNVEDGKVIDLKSLPIPSPVKLFPKEELICPAAGSTFIITPTKKSNVGADGHTSEPEHSGELSRIELSEEENIGDECLLQEGSASCLRRKSKKKTNYCKYCKCLVTNFCRHLERKHSDTIECKEINKIMKGTPKEREKKKKEITIRLIKEWNDIYNKDILSKRTKNEELEASLIPVKRSSADDVNEFIKCRYCKGLYRRRKFSIHLKHCSVEKKLTSPCNTSRLTTHSLPLTPEVEGLSEDFLLDIVNGIKNNDTGLVVKTDPLILLYGVCFARSRKHESEKNYVRRQMRTLGNLLIKMRSIDPTITNLESCFSPKKFKVLIKAVETWSKLNPVTGEVQISSVPYRVLSCINECINILLEKRTEDVDYSKEAYQHSSSIQELIDFEMLIKRRWAALLGKAASKSMKTSKTLVTGKLASEDDIYLVCSYITEKYLSLKGKLQNASNKAAYYDQLMDLLLTHILCLCRRRPVDLKRAKLDHYYNMDDTDDLISEAKINPGQILSEEDLKNFKFFKTFYVPGKNYDKVPVVLTPTMKGILDILIQYRPLVGISVDTLFIKSNNTPADAGRSLEKVKEKVKLSRPNDMTALGLRHHAATFSKLHSDNPRYQDFLASAMGHTLFMHKTKYDLPVSVLHKVFVAPTLHKMTVGKTSTKKNVLPVEAAQEEIESAAVQVIPEDVPGPSTSRDTDSDYSGVEESSDDSYHDKIKRVKWTTPEKQPIFTEFGDDLLQKKKIPRKRIVQFYSKNRQLYRKRSQKQVVSFVSNMALRKVKQVTPDINKFKKRNIISDSDSSSVE